MHELNDDQILMISGGNTTGAVVAGGARGALYGAGVAAGYVALASNPVGWIVLGTVVGGAAITAGVAYFQEKK